MAAERCGGRDWGLGRGSGLGARGSGLGARGSGLGARGSGLGARKRHAPHPFLAYKQKRREFSLPPFKLPGFPSPRLRAGRYGGQAGYLRLVTWSHTAAPPPPMAAPMSAPFLPPMAAPTPAPAPAEDPMMMALFATERVFAPGARRRPPGWCAPAAPCWCSRARSARHRDHSKPAARIASPARDTPPAGCRQSAAPRGPPPVEPRRRNRPATSRRHSRPSDGRPRAAAVRSSPSPAHRPG